MSLLNLTAIFIGGGLGAWLRYGAGLFATRIFGSAIPGTFAVNSLGCLAIGAVCGLLHGKPLFLSHEQLRLFISVGLLGALTTFSTFNLEVFSLLKSGRIFCGLGYMLLSCSVGLLCTCVGFLLTRSN